MKKNYFYGIAAALMMGTVALSSCSSDELTVGNEAQIAKDVAKTYSFSIQATMDDEAGTRVFNEIGTSTISSSFSTEESVYVFFKRGTEIAYGDNYVKPTEVSNDGSSCTLSLSGLHFIPSTFTPAVGDEVYLYYGMTSDTNDHTKGYYVFVTDGTLASAKKMDYNLAEMVVTDLVPEGEGTKLIFGQKENNTKTNFSFVNINSVFRQTLTFVDEDGDPFDSSPTIKRVIISNEHNTAVKKYIPFGGNDAYEYGPIEIDNLSLKDGDDIYFSTIFNSKNKNAAITFTAIDSEGKTYSLTKDAPTGGFENNKYYYCFSGEAELELLSGVITPTISGLNSYEQKPADSGDGSYSFYITDDPADFSISGNSEQNTFILAAGGTVTLDNINATIGEDVFPENYFMNIGEVDNGFTLNLNGDNIITVLNGTSPFNGGMGASADLKLSCEGDGPATLTIRTADEYNSGFQAFNNIDFSMGDLYTDDPIIADKLSSIAADGYNVERSERTTVDVNGVTLYEWTFTVSKINP